MLFTTSEYHTIAFSFNEQIIATSQNQNTNLQVRLKLDDETFNTTISDTYELASFTFSIGKKKTNNTKKMLRNENNTYPLNGKIETIATSAAFCEEDTLNSLISSLNGITTTKTYDELGILQGKTIHHNGNNIISNSYNYYLDENSNVIATVPEFEFIKYKSTDGTDEQMSIIYQYDEIGRLIRYIIAGQVSYDYTYDDNGFISVVKESTNYVDSNFTDITETTYSYDSNGNILRKSTELRNIYSPGSTSETDNYTYEGEKLVSYNANQIRYDSSKPMFISSYNGVSYTYEADRLKSFIVGGRAYYLHYDDEGRRIKKLNYQNVGSEYFYDGNLLIKEINPEYTLDFLYDEYNELYGFVKDNSEEYFYIRDYFKNILAITNKSGEIVVKYKYDAFGKFTISGDLATTIGKINPFKYKGYYYDNETNLFLVTSRYYNPELGRFIQPVDLSSLNSSSINGLNLYAYANSNPISFSYNNSSVVGSTNVAGGLNLGWLANGLDMVSTIYGLYTSISGLVNHTAYFVKNLIPFADDMTMLGASMKDGVLAFNQFSWGLGKLDIFGIALGVGLDIYDSIQRGVSPGGVVLGATLTAAKGVVLIYLNKGILYGATALGSLIPIPGVGTAVGFVAGGVACIIVDVLVSDLLDELIDKIAK